MLINEQLIASGFVQKFESALDQDDSAAWLALLDTEHPDFTGISGRHSIALQAAASRGHAAAVEHLLVWEGSEADIRADGNSAMWYASKHGHAGVVGLLLEAGAGICASMFNPLRTASKHGHAGVVELLLAAGADVHAEREEALREAISNGHAAVARLLLAAGANVHIWSDYSLQNARNNCNAEVVALLSEYGS